ncbi:MAG: DUF58 domain-containing protein [Opitutae bacterium]
MSEHVPETKYLDPEILQRIGDLELIAREVVEGLRVGSHRSPLRGFSTEFAHHRQYVPGDPLRSIDWRVYGRSDRYYTKLYEAETNFDCHLLIDSSSSMTYGSGKVNKLEYAKFLGASLAYLVLKQRDSVGISLFDSEIRAYLPPRSTMGILLQMDQLLKDTKPTPKTAIAKQLHDVALLLKRRSFVIVISDFLSEVEDVLAGLEHLKFAGHNVMVLHTLDPHELEFPFEGTWQFDGLEGEEPLITQPERIKEDYLSNLKEYMSAFSEGCLTSQIEYALVDTSRPLDIFLNEFFNQRESLLNGSAGRVGS